jgi:hypothetical protein
MPRVGLQLGADRVRAVVLSGWPRQRVRAVEVPFDQDRPDEAVDALRALVGTPRRIAVAVDLHLVRTKRVSLPAVSAAERRNILRLEPDRFFAVRGDEIVPAICPDSALVFAATTSALAGWIRAIERIAPVDVVEATPVALARALETVSIGNALVVFDGQHAGIAVAEIRGYRVARARRLFGTASQVANALAADGFGETGVTAAYLDPWTDDRHAGLAALCPGVSLHPLPPLGRPGRHTRIAGPFAAAFGAALALASPPPVPETLLSPAHEARIRRRRTAATARAAAVCAAGFLFAVSSADSRADKTVRSVEGATAVLNARAAPALAMQTELAKLVRRADAIQAIDAERQDPLRVLRALSAALPAGAFVKQIRVTGPDWQIDGSAPNASAVLSALGSTSEFRDVHFLSAVNRDQIANQAYESFALGFRFVPAS